MLVTEANKENSSPDIIDSFILQRFKYLFLVLVFDDVGDLCK